MKKLGAERGLSLIELMIAIALGLIVLLAVTVIFANASRSRSEMEKSNRQTENGRYASQLLANNLRMAGFMAEFDPSVLTLPATMPDPCATATADLINALPLHVQGYDNASAIPTCISDVKAGTDILVIRRASSCIAGSAGCEPFASGTPHLQASLCTPAVGGTELAAPITSNADYAANYFTLATSSSSFNMHKTDCTTPADIYRYHVDIYFIANNNNAGDGIPTLKRAELGAGSFTIVPLVDGIEDMQIEYGVDGDPYNPLGAAPPRDGIVDSYWALPPTMQGWRDVMSVQVFLLARNIEITAGHTDNRTYTLGAKTVGPIGDNFKRHVYSSTTHLANPSWRRQ